MFGIFTRRLINVLTLITVQECQKTINYINNSKSMQYFPPLYQNYNIPQNPPIKTPLFKACFPLSLNKQIAPMQGIDTTYILDNETLLFDYLFHRKIGLDSSKNYVYHISDKYREPRATKFLPLSQTLATTSLPSLLSALLIAITSNQCKYVQSIIDFTVGRESKIVMVTMPLVEKSLYSVIKDNKIGLDKRWGFVKNLVDGITYVHQRRRNRIGAMRPQAIAIIEQDIPMNPHNPHAPSGPSIYACLNQYMLLTQTTLKPQKIKWTQTQLNYYDPPQTWNQIYKRKKQPLPSMPPLTDQIFNIKMTPEEQAKEQKSIVERQMGEVWGFGLVVVELLSGKRISELLNEGKQKADRDKGEKEKDKEKLTKQAEIGPGRILREYKIKQRMLKKQPQGPEKQAQIKKLDDLIAELYHKLLKYIDCVLLKELLEKMLSYKASKRPVIKDVYNVVDKLEVVERNNKNLAKITALKRSLRNLRDCKVQKTQKEQERREDDIIQILARDQADKLDSNIGLQQQIPKQKDPNELPLMSHLNTDKQENMQKQIDDMAKRPSLVFKDDNQQNDDKKSVVSMRSIRSSKSSRSHYSQTRKRTQMDFSKLLYTRHQICEIQAKPSNSMYRSYYDDCKSRLIIDENFTVPAVRMPLHKGDKVITIKVKGETEEDMTKWEIQKAIGPKSIQSCLYPEYYDPRLAKAEPSWLRSSQSPASPPQPPNQNLSNYHYLSLKQFQHPQTLPYLFAPNSLPPTLTSSFSFTSNQFTLNLSNGGLGQIPKGLGQGGQAQGVKYLVLSGNCIASLKGLDQGGIVNSLVVLDLRRNFLKRIDVQMWKFSELKEVYLGNNLIQKIQNFSGERNDEETCDQANGGCQNGGAQVKENEQSQSNGLTNREADLNIKLPSQPRRSCLNLQKLYLNSNKIAEITNIQTLPNLKTLSLKDNPLRQNLGNVEAFDLLKDKGVKVLM